MTLVVTLVISLINASFELLKWLKAWGLSFVVAFPLALAIMPITNKVVFKFVKK